MVKYGIYALFGAFLISGIQAQNPDVIVAEIQFEGLKKTQPKVLERELLFHIGDTLHPSELAALIEKSQQNAYNLGLFTFVEIQSKEKSLPDSLSSTKNEIIFIISVQERWYIWPKAYLDLEERTFNEWWQDKDLDRLVYGLGVDWQNFSGWNDKLFLYAQGGYSRNFRIDLLQPFLFYKAQTEARFSFFYIENKEIGYNTKQGILQLARLQSSPIRRIYTGQIALTKRLTQRKKLSLTVDFQYYRLNDSIQLFNPLYLTRANTTREFYPSLALSYQNDQRDLSFFPQKGYKYGVYLKQSGFLGIGSTSFAHLTLNFSHYLPLSPRLNFSYGAESLLVLGKHVPYFNKFFLGFNTAAVRGYENYVVDASSIQLAKTELKYAILPRRILHWKKFPLKRFRDISLGLYLSVFCDLGYITDKSFNNQDNYLKNKLLRGYGAGVNLITIYDAFLRVEYSFNHIGQGGIYLNTQLPLR